MTATANDSIAKQIQRGEIFNSGTNQEITRGTSFFLLVSVGSKDVSFAMEVSTAAFTVIIMTAGVSAVSDGVEAPLVNMNLGSAKTTDTAVYVDPVTVTGGTIKFALRAPDGEFTDTTAFNRETGVILEANTKYAFSISNNSGPPADYQITWFVREV